MSELLQSLGASGLWVLVFLLLVANFNGKKRHKCRVSSVLAVYPVFILFQILLVKLLDVFHVLTTPYCIGGYLGVIALALALAYYGGSYSGGNVAAEPDDENNFIVKRLTFLCVAIVVAGVMLYSLIVPVHIWDVQAYHMPMVASYVQNGTLAGWPTQDLRQIYRVNAGELQMLNLALLARSDAWVELPNVLALVISVVAVFGIAKLLGFEGPPAYFSAVLMLTAPQILLGSTTAKNDLIFLAAILCSFYWLIRLVQSSSSSANDLANIAFLALSGSLAAATKVMGLNVLATVAVVLAIWFAARRVSYRTLGWFCLFAVVVLFLVAGDVYWNNFLRSRMPVGIVPDEVRIAIGLSTLVEAAKYYLYDLSFKRLVILQSAEHDLSHYGYFFPIVFILGSLAVARQLKKKRFQEAGLTTLCLSTVILFFSIAGIRKPIPYDQRFMTWMVPAFSLLAISQLRGWPKNSWLIAVSFAGAFSIQNLIAVYTNSANGIFVRSFSYLLQRQELPRLVHVAVGEHARKLQGFDIIERQARASDRVLYVGGEDTWMYPSWGARFTREVSGVRDVKDVSEKMESRGFRFIVVENAAADEFKTTVNLSAARHRYVEVANGGERRVFRRET